MAIAINLLHRVFDFEDVNLGPEKIEKFNRMKNRRVQQRCVKTVGMHCALLSGNVYRPVTLRNFSGSGLFFETAVQILPGSYILLRTTNANDTGGATMGANAPPYTLDANDPDACSLFRSHTVAQVRRCERLADHGDSPSYGVAAEIQMLTD